MKNTILLLLVLMILLPLPLGGQELVCDVTVNIENISSAQRENLRNFKADIERYLNGNRWTTEDYGDEKIRCSFSFFFQSGTDDGRYSVQVFVSSLRPIYIGNDPSDKSTPILRVLDEKLEFSYRPNQRIVQDEFQFDPLADFLDFYAYLIIGLDAETYTELSGTQFFQKALNICNLGQSSAFPAGWHQVTGSYSRFNIVDELMNSRYQPFRFAFYNYHFEGLDLLATQDQKGMETMLRSLEAIGDLRKKQDPRSILVKTFFDAKYQEIAEVFLRWPNRDVYQRIASADPLHQSTYLEYSTR